MCFSLCVCVFLLEYYYYLCSYFIFRKKATIIRIRLKTFRRRTNIMKQQSTKQPDTVFVFLLFFYYLINCDAHTVVYLFRPSYCHYSLLWYSVRRVSMNAPMYTLFTFFLFFFGTLQRKKQNSLLQKPENPPYDERIKKNYTS